jgi:hypothetical protein
MNSVSLAQHGDTHARLALGATMLVWLLARLAGLHGLMLVAGMALACLLPWLALVRLAGLAGGSGLWTFFVAATLSPPLLALVAGLAAVPGRPVALAGQVVLALCAALAVLPARRVGARAVAEKQSPAPVDRLALAAGDDPFALMAALNTWSTLLSPIGGYLLARALGLAPRTSAWSAPVVALGTNPSGIAWFLGLGLVGETRGLRALAASISDCNQGMGAPALRFPCFQSSPLARFWTPTAYDFGLALLLLVLLALLAAWERPRLRNAAGFGGALR